MHYDRPLDHIAFLDHDAAVVTVTVAAMPVITGKCRGGEREAGGGEDQFFQHGNLLRLSAWSFHAPAAAK
jgi:hypothetical protein